MEVQKRILDQEDTDTRKRAKNDNEDQNQVVLPWDVIGEILSYVPYEGSNWLDCRLVCKKFLEICERVQDPSVNDNAPVLWAFEHAKFDIARKLLGDPRVGFGLCGWDCTYSAVIHGEVDMVKLLLSRPDVDPTGYCMGKTLLRIAVERGLPDVAVELMQDPRTEVNKVLFEEIVHGKLWQLVEPFVKKKKKDESWFYSRMLCELVEDCDNHLMVKALLKYTPARLREYKNIVDIAFKLHRLKSLKEIMKVPGAELPWTSLYSVTEQHAEIVKEAYESGRLENPAEFFAEDTAKTDRLLLRFCARAGILNLTKYFMHKIPPDELTEFLKEQHSKSPFIHTTTEIAIETLEYCNLFDEMSYEVARQACIRGFPETAKGLMQDPRFKATPEQIKYLKDTIEMTENL